MKYGASDKFSVEKKQITAFNPLKGPQPLLYLGGNQTTIPHRVVQYKERMTQIPWHPVGTSRLRARSQKWCVVYV